MAAVAKYTLSMLKMGKIFIKIEDFCRQTFIINL